MTGIGHEISHYRILDKIGQGGMGAVYRAKDLTLGRDVAIKVLPEEFACDPDRFARFQREAKLLASLNHPNIAAIYGLEISEGTHFLVLELVEGETLAEFLPGSAGVFAGVDEILKISLQIAEALEAAHEKGVIHRDLKPANIKVTPEGKVKVLDFGLAKAFAPDPADVNLSNSPTLSMAATKQGMILGTAAYMSPEQAKGKPVDKRADIWAFGCVLYEMLTGKAAFQGDEIGEILASVIKGDMNLDLLPPNINPRIRDVLRHCLQKDLKKRYRDIGDVQFELEQALTDPRGVMVPPMASVERQSKLRLVLPWVAATVAVTAVVAGLAGWSLRPRDPHPITRFSHLLPSDQRLYLVSAQTIAISPDASRFVCATTGGLYSRSMDQLDGRIIPGTEGDGRDPFFSHDGQWVGYVSRRDGRLKKIPIGGGSPMTICNTTNNSNASWGKDNTIVFDDANGIMRVSADGGIPVAIAKQMGGLIWAPQILPDAKTLLFTLGTKTAVQSLASGRRKELFAGQNARYIPSGHIVYVQEATIFAIPFDLDKLAVTGGPVPMVPGVLVQGPARYAVSDSGVLVYISGVRAIEKNILVWVDRNGKEEAVEAPPQSYFRITLSPDGTRVAVQMLEPESSIWILDLIRRTLSRLTVAPGINQGGVWTPDGKRLVFAAERDAALNIYWQAADGSDAPEPLTKIQTGSVIPMAFSPDGKQLLFIEGSFAAGHISLLNLGGSAAPRQLLGRSSSERNPQISPNGRWLAYDSVESGVRQVYVRPFPDANAGRWQISTGGGDGPLWSGNGRELFYSIREQETLKKIMAVPVDTGQPFKAGTPKLLFEGEYYSARGGGSYSVTPDGRRFLMIKNAAGKSGGSDAQHINVVLNWFEELKQRVK